MTGENFKYAAKCRYSRRCAIFGSNILKPEYEKQMCQPGVKKDQKYIPQIPQDIEEKQDGLTYIGANPRCPAFERFIYQGLYDDLEDLMGDIERVLHGKLPLFNLTDLKTSRL